MWIFLGAPGSGKGTQAQQLVRDGFGVQLSTGDLLRVAISDGTELGLKAKGFMDQGQLVPDDLVIGLIKDKIKHLGSNKNVLFDGFPRTLDQAKALDKLLEEMSSPLKKVIYLKVESSELISRLSGRRTCPGCGAAFHVENIPPRQEGLCDHCGKSLVHRKDDMPEAIGARLKTYEDQTVPLINYYEGRGLLGELAAVGNPSEIYEGIKKEMAL